jgi:hypothetical protein
VNGREICIEQVAGVRCAEGDLCLVKMKKGRSVPVEVRFKSNVDRDVFCLVVKKYINNNNDQS